MHSRLPIQLALGFPDRLPAGIQGLDLAKLGRLTFEDLNRESFPSVGLAYSAGEQGSTFPAVQNLLLAARALGVSRGKLYRKLRRHGIYQPRPGWPL